MLSSIHPLGEEGRGQRYVITVAAFVAGSVLGGVSTGLVVGVMGASVGGLWAVFGLAAGFPVRLVLLAAAMVIVVALVARRRGLPGLARQVNENWLVDYRGWVYGLGYGLQLGAGVATYVRSGAVLIWLAAMAVVGSFGGWTGLAAAAGVGVTFGLTRGLSILTTRSITSPEQLIAFHRRLHGRAEPMVVGGGSG